jgi:hypothetical protein
MSKRIERRSLPRLPASSEPARIAWKAGGSRRCKEPAHLIDVHENGAGIIAARPGKPGEVLWLGMASLPCEWVKAIIRGEFPDGSRWRFHLAFCEPCPVGLLEEMIGVAGRYQDVPTFHDSCDDNDDDETTGEVFHFRIHLF